MASAGLYASLHLIPDNHANIPPLSFFTGRMPFLPPNQQRQSTEGTTSTLYWVLSTPLPGLLTTFAKSIANNDTNTLCWNYCLYQYRNFYKKYWRYFNTNTFTDIFNGVQLAPPAMGHWSMCPLDIQKLIFSQYILQSVTAEKSVGSHVKKSITSSFLTESHFTWQLDVEHFRK